MQVLQGFVDPLLLGVCAASCTRNSFPRCKRVFRGSFAFKESRRTTSNPCALASYILPSSGRQALAGVVKGLPMTAISC